VGEFEHLYAAAVQLAVPFVQKALQTDGKVPTASVAEQAVELAVAIHDAVNKAMTRTTDSRRANRVAERT
jgi:hypothetical protein